MTDRPMRARLSAVGLLGVAMACNPLPTSDGWTGGGDTGRDTLFPETSTSWTCNVAAGTCACIEGGTGTLTTCDPALGCCIYWDGGAAACECTDDDEVTCDQRAAQDLDASRVASCPPG